MLKDKIAVITGGTRGIGYGIAKEFAKNNAKVIFFGSNSTSVDKALENFAQEGYKLDGFGLDVANFEVVKATFKEIFDKYSKIDILVNNAGITKDALLMRMKEKDWDNVINTNLKGTFNCTQNVSKFMMKQKFGSIINIASVVGLIGNAGQTNYAASKGGIIAFTKSVAKELGGRGIRCNAIAPGFIKTYMTKILSQKIIDKYLENIPLKTLGTTQDVADLCLFLGSDKSKYITGQTINVDGGLVT